MGFPRFYKTLHTALALGYLLLGLAVVWHAPHFSQAHASIGTDRHAQHEAVFNGECALCTVKTAPQLGMARFGHGLVTTAARASAALRDTYVAAARLRAYRSRAPPSLPS
jgi:hypothetical protein